MDRTTLHTWAHRLARRQWAYPLILFVGMLCFLPNLGSHGLWDIDEAHNAECAREMWESGNFIVPTFNYTLRTDKPAMLYWWIGLSYSLFGVSEWSARLPSVLAGLCSLLLTYEIARRLFSSVTGLLSACILASTFMFSISSHAVTPDAILICMVQLTFFTWIVAYDRRQPWWLLLTGCAAGLAVLTKGPVGVALPGAVVVLFLLWQRDLRFLYTWRTPNAISCCLLVALPWYIYVGIETRWEFIKGFLFTHNMSRFSAPMEGHQGPFFYHLIVILVAFAPWSIFLGPTIWNAARHKAISTTGKPWAIRFLLCWIGVWFLVFSIAATKLPNYVLPTYPPLAMLTGVFLVRWWKWSEAATPITWPIPAWFWRISLACFILIGIALLLAIPLVAGWIPIDVLAERTIPNVVWLLPLALVPLLAGWLTWKRWSQNQIGWGVATVLVASAVLTATLGAIAPTVADQERASKPLAQLLHGTIGNRDVRVGMHPHYNRPSMVFYVQRQIIRCKNEQEALDALAARVPTYMLVPAKSWPKLAEQLGGRFTIHEQRHDFTAGQDILLISNTAVMTQSQKPLPGE
jgi:4-amino-4-deoxy-L-arabinose transferase-like glycosyltransferase